jgi:hypothetical protein
MFYVKYKSSFCSLVTTVVRDCTDSHCCVYKSFGLRSQLRRLCVLLSHEILFCTKRFWAQNSIKLERLFSYK